jgi:uncharacterized protein
MSRADHVSSSGAAEVDLRGERVQLLPQRALFWPAQRTLIVADTHFAKDDIFRRAGIALPRGPAIADLQRLSMLITQHQAQRLLILGDFVHGALHTGDSFWHAFRVWRTSHAQLNIEVRGQSRPPRSTR